MSNVIDGTRSGLIGKAAAVGAALLGVVALLQLALAIGAPYGQHVWGGRSETEVLPAGLRVASAIGALVLVWMATVILARADVIKAKPVPTGWLGRTTWGITALMVLNTLGNVASESTFEQTVFTPITAVIAILSAVVARRGPRP